MSTTKLTIVPVTLDPITNDPSATTSPQNSPDPSCIIKTTSAEISFFNGVDERIIQTILKELNKL